MILKNLTLRQFRNHTHKNYLFSPSINEIVGRNGTGKTNLVEAIHLLCLARSWRTAENKKLIQKDKNEAYVGGEVEEGSLQRKIEVVLQKEGRVALVNGNPLAKLSQLSGLFNCVLFTPEDSLFFRDSPGVRRLFLDETLSRTSSAYLHNLRQFRHILQERNAALKERRDDALLETLTEQLILSEEPLVKERNLFLKRLIPVFQKTSQFLLGEERKVEFVYHPFLKEENFVQEARDFYQKSKERDYLLGSTQNGIHREDFEVSLEGENAANFASQGEGRILSLALKISPSFLEEGDKKPVAILDDVFGELDKEHAKNLVRLLPKLGQCFITGTEEHIYQSHEIVMK